MLRRTGRSQFPYLIDPNTGAEMFESADIVRYLFERYGDGEVPAALAGRLANARVAAISLLRPLRGAFARGRLGASPDAMPVLYGFEACAESRLVREALCALEVPYVFRASAVGSRHRKEVARLVGSSWAPVLVDRSLDEPVVGALAIVSHLERSYATA